tara:strand:+ start:1442 stop:2749 length:1308 start_codon:yes stop_codon:yes gene_type:complete
MARVNKITGRAVKRKTPRGAPRLKRGSKLTEPSWEGWEEWSGEHYHRASQHARDWYYQNYKPADLYPAVDAWMSKNGYTKEQIKQVRAAPTYALSITAGITAKLLMAGMPDYNQKHADYWETLPGTMGTTQPVTVFLKKRIEEAMQQGAYLLTQKKEVEKEKAKVYQPTIQERIREQVNVQTEEIEEWLDGWIKDPKSFDPKGFNFKRHFQDYNVTQAHARKISSLYDGEISEYKELQNPPSKAEIAKMDERALDMLEQLKEGYAHLSKEDVKKILEALGNIQMACQLVVDTSKATRKTRKRKPKSAEKLVEKLKYCKVDNKNSLASINPIDIIYANELWVFNIKTRKIGKYVASNIDPQGQQREGSGLSVKGTTIIGFNEKESVQKTLRKPEEKIKEFKEAGKVKLRTFIEDINAVDIKLNGRINPDTILLKVS